MRPRFWSSLSSKPLLGKDHRQCCTGHHLELEASQNKKWRISSNHLCLSLHLFCWFFLQTLNCADTFCLESLGSYLFNTAVNPNVGILSPRKLCFVSLWASLPPLADQMPILSKKNGNKKKLKDHQTPATLPTIRIHWRHLVCWSKVCMPETA